MTLDSYSSLNEESEFSFISDSEKDNSELPVIIRGILTTNANTGVTIQEIQDQYYQMIGEEFPIKNDITEYLLNIKGITCYVNTNGTRVFNLASSEKSQHILSMVQNQKLPRNRNLLNARSNSSIFQPLRNCCSSVNGSDGYNSDLNSVPSSYLNRQYNSKIINSDNFVKPNYIENRSCFFKDNYNIANQRRFRNYSQKHDASISTNQQNESTNWIRGIWNNNLNKRQRFDPKMSFQKGAAHLYDYQLMGDDFFMSMAFMELGCRFKRENNIQKSGYCESGLTLKKAIKLVNTLPYINPNIIINVGSVDILNGRELIDMEYDFRCLKWALFKRNISPIFTTLAPLANISHRPDERSTVERFNDFIRRNTDVHVIDIWSCMANRKGQTLYECYQLDARYVTGSTKPHVLWNKLGRQRVLQKIKKEIEILPF